MLSDLRFTFRQIARFPGYTAVVVLTLAFGIAVNTQIFAIVSAMFFQPMPVRDADRLVTIVLRNDLINLPMPVSILDFQDMRADSKALTEHIAFFSTPAHVGMPGKSPERIGIEAVTPDAFAKYGVHAALGRTLQPSDGEMPPGTPVAMLSHAYWQTRYGGAPDILGRTILINAKPFTIVGVARPGFGSFSYMLASSVFIPSGAVAQIRPDGSDLFKY
ncbi:MAG TPA: ABC transporter permease, partial [Opitutus sp.]|nr:ABC transporter permease [Opitutus sp.]